MARTIIKTKHPFDNLLYWNEYINYINEEFSSLKEKNKWTPQVDIEENDGNYVLHLAVPGFSSKDIDINYKNGFLTIKGQKKVQVNNAKKNNHRPDIYSDNFKSVVRFPQGIEKKKIIKVLKDGILKIRIPVPTNIKEQ